MINAYPYVDQNTYNNDPSNIDATSNMVRREDYDPYGFNSILSRFHKRSNDKHNTHSSFARMYFF